MHKDLKHIVCGSVTGNFSVQQRLLCEGHPMSHIEDTPRVTARGIALIIFKQQRTSFHRKCCREAKIHENNYSRVWWNNEHCDTESHIRLCLSRTSNQLGPRWKSIRTQNASFWMDFPS